MEPEHENPQPEETPSKPAPAPGVFRRVPHGEKDAEPEPDYHYSRNSALRFDDMMPVIITVVCITAISFLGDKESAQKIEQFAWWEQILLVFGACVGVPIAFLLLGVLLLVCVNVYDAVSGVGRGS